MKLIKDLFLIHADLESQHISSITGHDGNKLFLDTDYQKYKHAVQIGTVAYSPQIIDKEYSNDNKVIDGDTVLFHHFVCQPDNKVVHDGKELYKCEYFHIWAKIVSGNLEPLEDFIFVEPIAQPEDSKKTNSGLVLPSEKKFISNCGRVFALSQKAKINGLRVGDIVFFTNDADYDINVEGKDLYRMRMRNIIGVERSGKLTCLSDKMLVLDVTDSVTKDGLVYKKSERDRCGIVYNIGHNIKGISLGDKVNFFNGLTSQLMYGGQMYSFLKTEDINYKYL